MTSAQSLPIYQIDAFARIPFAGNPAAVVPLSEWLPDSAMQAIAAENNLAETAFFVKDGSRYHIRWFTPAIEVDLCGHATLASAWVLYNVFDLNGEIYFDSRSGPLRVLRNDAQLILDFPTIQAEPVTSDDEWSTVAEALGCRPVEIHRDRNYLAVLDSPEALHALSPDFALLKKLSSFGLIATSPGNDSYDYMSRYFAPSAGVDEDPATGSSQCTLIPYWSHRLGKSKMQAFQASARGGDFTVEYCDDRVLIGGTCHLYLEGKIHV